jgi:hypothetical protein
MADLKMKTLPTDLPLEIALERIFTTRQAAEFKGVSLRKWQRLKAAGKTPKPIQRGVKAEGYKLRDLIAMDA